MIDPNTYENIKELFPKKIEVYTDHGTFNYNIGDTTREGNILRAAYNGSTYEETGEALADGEPDYVCFDIHFINEGTKRKLSVNITYGDAMVSEFVLMQPNIVKIGKYEGIDSKVSPETHFGFSDTTLKSLVNLFNSLNDNFRFTTKEFKFIDKYPDTYKHNEQVKLMPMSNKQTILIIDNSKPPKHRYIQNLLNYFQSRGIEFIKIESLKQAYQVQTNDVVGIIMSGSEYHIDDSPEKQELFKWAITEFTCPTLAICYSAQSMMAHYGATLYRGKLLHDNLKFTNFKEHHLLSGIDCQKFQFSFSFKDYIKEVPQGFEKIATIGNRIVMAANDLKQEYALFFHPENIELTQKVLDNFMDLVHPAQKEQDKILQGHFESIMTFSQFCSKI